MNHGIRKTLAKAAVLAALVIVGLTVPASPVEASEAEFTASLDELQEVGCNVGHFATGSGTFKLNKATGELSFNVTFTPLSAAETGSHIHGPAGPGVSAPIIRGLPAGSPKVGTVAPNLTPAEIADMQAGLYYVNVHSTNCPAGEIRGQILPVSVGGESIAGELLGLDSGSAGTAWWIVFASVAGVAAIGAAAALSVRRVRS